MQRPDLRTIANHDLRDASDVTTAQHDQSGQAGVGTLPSCSSPVLDYVSQLHREFASVTDGQVATYIPELAKADPKWFGICLVTATGHVYEAGDSRQPFTIQSISKPAGVLGSLILLRASQRSV